MSKNPFIDRGRRDFIRAAAGSAALLALAFSPWAALAQTASAASLKIATPGARRIGGTLAAPLVQPGHSVMFSSPSRAMKARRRIARARAGRPSRGSPTPCCWRYSTTRCRNSRDFGRPPPGPGAATNPARSKRDAWRKGAGRRGTVARRAAGPTVGAARLLRSASARRPNASDADGRRRCPGAAVLRLVREVVLTVVTGRRHGHWCRERCSPANRLRNSGKPSRPRNKPESSTGFAEFDRA